MLVIIKSPPGSDEAKEGIDLCRDNAADILLVGDAVGLAEPGKLGGFCGTVYAIAEDIEASGIEEYEKGIKLLNRQEFEEFIKDAHVLGTF